MWHDLNYLHSVYQAKITPLNRYFGLAYIWIFNDFWWKINIIIHNSILFHHTHDTKIDWSQQQHSCSFHFHFTWNIHLKSSARLIHSLDIGQVRCDLTRNILKYYKFRIAINLLYHQTVIQSSFVVGGERKCVLEL